MSFTAKHCLLEKQFDKINVDCFIVGVYAKGQLTPSAQIINKALKNLLSTTIKHIQFEGTPGQTHCLHYTTGKRTQTIMLVGCGEAKKITEIVHGQIATACAGALKKLHAKSAYHFLSDITVQKRNADWQISDFIIQMGQTYYDFNAFKSKINKKQIQPQLTFALSSKRDHKSIQLAIEQAQAMVDGMSYTKDLANTPANICTPTYLASEAKKLAKSFKKISVAVLSEKDMQELKMGSLLSVTQGSNTPAKLITLEYRGAKKQTAPYVLVGKGITFDTGGNSLKPAVNMIGMKYDMCGGASVLGIIKAIAELDLPLNVNGVIPACENTPGGSATRPDDIVTSMSGQTIEILNTDAEGRLILADALTYVERYKPKVVIDMATLTGACVVALGNLATAVMSNDDQLASKLLKASQDIHDRAWQLPLWADYHDTLNSPFADMKNIGDGGAGTITAGCFLEKFASNYSWAHLDIAGSAGQFSGPSRGATGRPVPMMVQYLINEAS